MFRSNRLTPAIRAAAAALTGLVLVGCAEGEPAAQAAPATVTPKNDTRLVVMVVVDQMMPMQLTRLAPYFDGGFGRFLAEGEQWTNASHGHGVTETAPGHASLATGTFPSRHGIVGNEWWGPEGETIRAVADPNVELVGGPLNLRTEPSSPANLVLPGISDYLQQLDPESQCVGVSGKDRSAILGMGWAGEAYWWFTDGRGFVSSSWYGDALPDWVLEWNTDWLERARTAGLSWESTLPDGIEEAGTGADDREGENKLLHDTTFPHEGPEFTDEPDVRQVIRAAQWVYETHFMDDFTLELAERAVRAKGLGTDEHVDYLLLGLSSCDTVGHRFGPRSHEVTDTLLRTDDLLGRFFELLDEHVGKGKWVAVLSADHGVLELPETLRAQGIDAQRIQGRALIDTELAAVERSLTETLGGDYVAGIRFEGLRFSQSKARTAGLDLKAARVAGAKALMQEAGAYFDYAFTAEGLEAKLRELAQSGERAHDAEALMARSYYPERSPDVSLVVKPRHVVWRAGTTHGSPWDYDREVPLIFLGPGFEPGVHAEPCLTVDVLPTLFDRMGLPVPANLDGHPLPGPGAR